MKLFHFCERFVARKLFYLQVTYTVKIYAFHCSQFLERFIKMRSKLCAYFVVFIFSFFNQLDHTNCVPHRLKVIQQTRTATDPFPYTQVFKSMNEAGNERLMKVPDTLQLFLKADRICLHGL